jgi:hypothetical protein
MDSVSIVYSILSFLIPSVFIIRSDANKIMEYSVWNIIRTYPVFIGLFLLARIWIAFDYYFVMFFADMLNQYPFEPKYIPFVSQTIIFIFDIAYWRILSKSALAKLDIQMAKNSITMFIEAMILMFFGMIIPVLAEVLLKAVFRM